MSNMIYNNYNINGVYYNGYTITKAYGCGGVPVWNKDTPSSYNRYTYTYVDGTTGISECSSDTEIKYSEIYSLDESYDTLKNFVVGSCIQTIGEKAFYVLKALESCDMSNSNVTSIGKDAFNLLFKPNVSALSDVKFSNVLETIGQNAFNSCALIRTVNFPSSLKYIEDSAFGGCSGLYDASSLKNTQVTKIENGVFADCTSLTKVEIPAVCKEISTSAFDNCTSLRTFDFKNVTTLGTSSFAKTSLSSLTLSNGVATIPTHCFSFCKSLTDFTLPNSVTSIGKSAFHYCSGLTSATIGSGVTRIEKSAFENCTSLTSMTIPSSIIYIGDRVFYNDYNLEYVEVLSTTPPILDGNETFKCSNYYTCNYNIYVPDEALEDYKLANNWSLYTDRLKPLSEKP